MTDWIKMRFVRAPLPCPPLSDEEVERMRRLFVPAPEPKEGFMPVRIEDVEN